MKQNFFLILIPFFLLAACSQRNTPQPKVRTQTEFNTALAKFYRAFYSSVGVEENVLSLDLFSEGISLNKEGYMQGTGSNLFFSDIFLASADSLLTADTYKADTTAQPLTFLPGINYEGNITGAYLLDLEESKLVDYQIFTDGSFELTRRADSIFINFELQREKGGIYKAQFSGVVPYTDLSAESPQQQQESRKHLQP